MTPFAINDLATLRRRALQQDLWRVTTMLTSTIANIDKTRAATIINQQLQDTPPARQQHFRQTVEQLERAARIDAIQQTPFDTVIRKLKGATSMIRIKVWCEGSTDRPVFRQLLKQLGEDDMADTLDFVGGWPNLLSENQPERWLDGCRQAVIIMDGDLGRKLTKKGQPLTDQAKRMERRFKTHALTLHVLKKYGIENYFPQHACEAVLQRDLTDYFPIPPHKKIEEHFSQQQPFWHRCLNRLRGTNAPSFYQKRRNEEIAEHLTLADINDTDLATILNDLKQRATDAREF